MFVIVALANQNRLNQNAQQTEGTPVLASSVLVLTEIAPHALLWQQGSMIKKKCLLLISNLID